MIKEKKYVVLLALVVTMYSLVVNATEQLFIPSHKEINKTTPSKERQTNYQSDLTEIDWKHARWIGYTEDNRLDKWATRELVFNQPPMDINTWIPTEEDLKVETRKTYPSVLLRKAFSVSENLRSAEIAICGLGLYELYLNGEKVGDRVLDPAQTSYDKRAFYVLHDVTALLRKQNSLGIMLGNGFYGQNMAFSAGLSYGKPRAILILNLTFKDGTSQQIVTDESWKAHSSPILFDNMYLGETYDARQELNNWTNYSYKDDSWSNVELMEAPTTYLVEQELEPMRKKRSVKPLAMLPAEKGWILDMGQNMSGWLQIQVEEKEGTEIVMRFSEHLMPDKKNIDPASTGIHVTGNTQTDIYICKGSGKEVWEPRFTYHGFRYVQMEGVSKKPNANQFVGWLVRSDVERIGSFKCSDDRINSFYEVSMWTIEDNLQGLLSDCPHRERCAWMGDAYVVAEAANFNFDLKRLWRKTSNDIKSVIGKSKAHFKDPFPYDVRTPSNVSVGKRLCLQARPDWGAATVMIPWFSYVYYGDKTIIEDSWTVMEGWMAYLDEKVQEEGIINGGFGDWCPPGGNTNMDTPPALTSTALYYQTLVAMGKMAKVLGKDVLGSIYQIKANQVKEAFNTTFFNSKTNSYGSQTGNAFALYSALVPEEKAQSVADNLSDCIMQENNGYFTTGIFGHRPLYTVLNDFGHSPVTKHLWSITDYPSLGFVTKTHGLTTWPEHIANWNKTERYYRNSFNHPMNSGFAASFHESLGGIRPDETNPGFKKFYLQPTFLEGLQWCEVAYNSPQGKIESHWKREGGIITWSVKVPENTSALVRLFQYRKHQILLNNKKVANSEFNLPAGRHVITIE